METSAQAGTRRRREEMERAEALAASHSQRGTHSGTRPDRAAHLRERHETREMTIKCASFKKYLNRSLRSTTVESVLENLDKLVRTVSQLGHVGSLVFNSMLVDRLSQGTADDPDRSRQPSLPDFSDDSLYVHAFTAKGSATVTGGHTGRVFGEIDAVADMFVNWPSIPRVHGDTQSIEFAAMGYKSNFHNHIVTQFFTRQRRFIKQWCLRHRYGRHRLPEDAAYILQCRICNIGGVGTSDAAKLDAIEGYGEALVLGEQARLGSDSGEPIDNGWLRDHFDIALRCTFHYLRCLEAWDEEALGDHVQLFSMAPVHEMKRRFVTLDKRAIGEALLRQPQAHITDDVWQELLDLDTVNKLAPRGYVFANLIQSDGVSVCFHFRRHATHEEIRRRDTAAARRRHARGLVHGLQSEALAADPRTIPRDAVIIGVDPGRISIVHMEVPVTAGARERPVMHQRQHRDVVGDPPPPPMEQETKTFKLTRAEYYREIRQRSAMERTARWEADIEDEIRQLSTATTKTARMTTLRAFVDAHTKPAVSTVRQHVRHAPRTCRTRPRPAARQADTMWQRARDALPRSAVMQDDTVWQRVWACKLEHKWAAHTFRQYCRRQACLDKFFSRVVKDEALRGKVLAFAYGSADYPPSGRGEPGGVPNARVQRHASKFGKVVRTAEHWTSQKHSPSQCHAQLMGISVLRNGAYEDVRGLKLCCSTECRYAVVDRDGNAARNMRNVCLSELNGEGRPEYLTARAAYANSEKPPSFRLRKGEQLRDLHTQAIRERAQAQYRRWEESRHARHR